jgi:sensor histidine kinase YesM
VPQYQHWIKLDSELRIVLARNTNKIVGRLRYPGLLSLAVFWIALGSLAYARQYLLGHSAAPPAKVLFDFLVWLTCFLPWIAFTPLVFRLERRYPLGTEGWIRNLGWLTVVVMPFAYIGGVVAQLLYAVFQILFGESPALQNHWWQVPFREVTIQLVLYWIAVVGAYVIRSLIQLQERDQQAAKLAVEKSQLETTLRQAELETLRARLNPHFLFNCLQNISVLTRDDPQTASQMLVRLGALLRTALRRDGTPETTLSSEIELTKTYVDVEKVRFADRLMVVFDIAPESESALIPALLLQPLVENAIVHGLRGINRTGIISICSRTESDNLIITVTDNGVGLPVKSATDMELGIGLSSTCERLEKMYPRQHSFSIRSLPQGGTEVRISIPLRIGIARVGVIADEQTALVAR